jgi:hypothetical protein
MLYARPSRSIPNRSHRVVCQAALVCDIHTWEAESPTCWFLASLNEKHLSTCGVLQVSQRAYPHCWSA